MYADVFFFFFSAGLFHPIHLNKQFVMQGRVTDVRNITDGYANKGTGVGAIKRRCPFKAVIRCMAV